MKTTLLPHATAGANQILCVKISRKTREIHASPKHETADSLANFTGIAIAKGKSMKTVILNLLAAMLFVAMCLHVHAQGVVDQESATGPVSPFTADFFNMQEDATLYQSFVPTLSTIDFVSMEFTDQPGNGTNGATVAVALFSSPLSSSIMLGRTTPVYMPNGFVNDGLYGAGVETFYFPTPIVLTPGQTYYLEPMVIPAYGGIVSDNPWDIMVLTDTYANGQLYSSETGPIESFDPTLDLWFQEGIEAVPEPTTLALIVFSCLVFIFRRRFKLPVLVFASILFTVPTLSVKAGQDSVVQATASAAGDGDNYRAWESSFCARLMMVPKSTFIALATRRTVSNEGILCPFSM
jgi:hypothetical protein